MKHLNNSLLSKLKSLGTGLLIIAFITVLAGCNSGNNNTDTSNTQNSTNNLTNHSSLSVKSTQKPIIAYLLLNDRNLSENGYINNTLIPQLKAQQTNFTRLVFSFVNPNFNLDSYNANKGNLANLIAAAGIVNKSAANAQQASVLKNLIDELNAKGIEVYFAVGGWANSCFDPKFANPSCSTNFPLTLDMLDNFKIATTNSVDLSNFETNIGQTATLHTQDYVQGWTKLAKEFGAKGIDLDYEENWFASEVTFYYGQNFLAANPTWARVPNGPFLLPLPTIKYGTYLKELTLASQADGLMAPSTAAPAPAAYDIHSGIGGSMYWCPVKDSGGNALCGQPWVSRDEISVVGGNLKGVLFDMAHYTDANTTAYLNNGVKSSLNYAGMKDSSGTPLFSGVINGLNSINVMTYDLDDGYDKINSSWCIGKVDGHFASRDPQTPGYKDIDCSIDSQVATLVEMFNTQVIQVAAGSKKPYLGFGVEAGFPNYPVNISDILPGGGNSPEAIQSLFFRWRDPFITFTLPLQESVVNDTSAAAHMAKIHSVSQVSDVDSSIPDLHKNHLLINKQFFDQMTSLGGNSFILWSLNNDDYDEHISKTGYGDILPWDYTQYVQANYSVFANPIHVNNTDYVGVIFDYSASPEYILSQANKYINN